MAILQCNPSLFTVCPIKLSKSWIQKIEYPALRLLKQYQLLLDHLDMTESLAARITLCAKDTIISIGQSHISVFLQLLLTNTHLLQFQLGKKHKCLIELFWSVHRVR